MAFRVQVSGINGTAQGRVSGNCQSGTWRVSSGANSQGAAFTLAKETGDQLLRSACVAPANLGR